MDGDYTAQPISIHSPRMGRDKGVLKHDRSIGISIHSPRMGRDLVRLFGCRYDWISIHSPRMGRDTMPT